MTMAPITGISSLATRALLAELGAAYPRHGGAAVTMTSIGGLDAARRVRAGDTFDVIVLARDALDGLAADGHLRPGSRVDLVGSPAAAAVPAGAPRPAIGSEAGLRDALTRARRVGFSTGPSGVHFAALVQRWGLAETLRDRLFQAPTGVPVADLLARGEVDLGVQQLSELIDRDGVDVLGPLPGEAAFETVFAGGVGAASTQPAAAAALLAFLASPATADIKRRHGMVPA